MRQLLRTQEPAPDRARLIYFSSTFSICPTFFSTLPARCSALPSVSKSGLFVTWPAVSLTLPSECVSLNRPGFEDLIHPRHRRGGGNVGIGFIDFQGLWEGRKTAPSFSGLPTNRHFHGLLRSPRTLRRRSSP